MKPVLLLASLLAIWLCSRANQGGGQDSEDEPRGGLVEVILTLSEIGDFSERQVRHVLDPQAKPDKFCRRDLFGSVQQATPKPDPILWLKGELERIGADAEITTRYCHDDSTRCCSLRIYRFASPTRADSAWQSHRKAGETQPLTVAGEEAFFIPKGQVITDGERSAKLLESRIECRVDSYVIRVGGSSLKPEGQILELLRRQLGKIKMLREPVAEPIRN